MFINLWTLLANSSNMAVFTPLMWTVLLLIVFIFMMHVMWLSTWMCNVYTCWCVLSHLCNIINYYMYFQFLFDRPTFQKYCSTSWVWWCLDPNRGWATTCCLLCKPGTYRCWTEILTDGKRSIGYSLGLWETAFIPVRDKVWVANRSQTIGNDLQYTLQTIRSNWTLGSPITAV